MSENSLELEGVPDFIKEKLLDMKSNIDQLENVFSQVDAQLVRDLSSKVRLNLSLLILLIRLI
jgi:hypothetical protein